MALIWVVRTAACVLPADEAEGEVDIDDEVEDDDMLLKQTHQWCREHATQSQAMGMSNRHYPYC